MQSNPPILPLPGLEKNSDIGKTAVKGVIYNTLGIEGGAVVVANCVVALLKSNLLMLRLIALPNRWCSENIGIGSHILYYGGQRRGNRSEGGIGRVDCNLLHVQHVIHVCLKIV